MLLCDVAHDCPGCIGQPGYLFAVVAKSLLRWPVFHHWSEWVSLPLKDNVAACVCIRVCASAFVCSCSWRHTFVNACMFTCVLQRISYLVCVLMIQPIPKRKKYVCGCRCVCDCRLSQGGSWLAPAWEGLRANSSPVPGGSAPFSHTASMFDCVHARGVFE